MFKEDEEVKEASQGRCFVSQRVCVKDDVKIFADTNNDDPDI